MQQTIVLKRIHAIFDGLAVRALGGKYFWKCLCAACRTIRGFAALLVLPVAERSSEGLARLATLTKDTSRSFP